MTLIHAILSPIPAIFAWIAMAWSFNHLKRREWAAGLGMAIIGLILIGVTAGLLLPAFGF